MKLTETKLRTLVREEILKEIGGGPTYKWNEILEAGLYSFQTPNHTYTVDLNPRDSRDDGTYRTLQVDFYTDEGRATDDPHSQITNEGNPMKVISTVFEIAEHAWKTGYYDNLKYMAFVGASKDGSEGVDTKRSKIYRHIVKDKFPNAEMFAKGARVFVKPNINKQK